MNSEEDNSQKKITSLKNKGSLSEQLSAYEAENYKL